MSTIISFADLQPVKTVRQPDPDMRISGAPDRTTLNYFEDIDYGLRSGTWSAGPGAYRVQMPAAKHEFFHVLSGLIRISCDDTGTVRQFAPGETGIMPPGFKGIFEIVEAASKFYVVIDHANVK
jgi:uncharacterized cupin superfamily protein